MTPRGRRPAALVALALLIVAAYGCAKDEPETCTQADLDQQAPSAMPVAVRVTQRRRLNGDRLDPLPASFVPDVSAARAWHRLRRVRQRHGGGRDELLLGRFTGADHAGVPAWVLFTSHLAQRLQPLPAQPGVTPRADADPCVFVDVLTAIDARTGEAFYGSTVTSSGRARVRPPSRTQPAADPDL